MRSYCTLFDKNYLYQGVALYNSLKRVSGKFRLYALCMDQTAYHMITLLKSDSLYPVSLDALMDSELAVVRNRTTHGQFCWVCQPLICEYILREFNVDMVTYLEADSLFFSDPEILFDELGDKSVSLVPHNYSPGFDQTVSAGRFCVQFNAFKNNECAYKVLDYWKKSCFLYDKNISASPGQTSLDEWPEKFEGVKIIQHRGAGVAPWNIQHGKLEVINSVPHVDKVPIVFYHYHEYGRYKDGSHELGQYPLTKAVVDCLYKAYVNEIRASEVLVHDVMPNFSYRREYSNNLTLKKLALSLSIQNLKTYLRLVKRKLIGRYNVYPDEYFTMHTEKNR